MPSIQYTVGNKRCLLEVWKIVENAEGDLIFWTKNAKGQKTWQYSKLYSYGYKGLVLSW